jgi:ribose 5-phosphate isomerase B
MEKIAIAADHAGYDLKEQIKKYLADKFEVIDFGTHSTASCDYPDYVHPLAENISNGTMKRGILICGTANGVAITANKYPHVRAGIAWEKELAVLTRQHNDANIICIPARFVAESIAYEIVDAFLTTDFEGGRHQNRVSKIDLK